MEDRKLNFELRYAGCDDPYFLVPSKVEYGVRLIPIVRGNKLKEIRHFLRCEFHR